MTITPIRPRWKGTLTDRERFVRQMHYQPIDRTFNMEFGYWDENFHLWPIFYEHGITNNGEADLFFNFDRIHVISGNVWLSPNFGKTVVELREKTKVLMNEDGLLAEVPLDGHDTIPHYLKSSIATPDDWKKVKAERFRLDDPARILDIPALQQRHPADRDYPLGVNCGHPPGRLRAGMRRHVHLDQAHIIGHLAFDQALGKIMREISRRGKIYRFGIGVKAFIQQLQRNRHRGDAQRSAFHGRADRARNGDAFGYVLAVINPGHHQVGLFTDDFKNSVHHGLRRRAADCVSGPFLAANLQPGGGNAPVRGDRHTAPGGGSLVARGSHRHIANFGEGFCRGPQARREDAVVIGQ